MKNKEILELIESKIISFGETPNGTKIYVINEFGLKEINQKLTLTSVGCSLPDKEEIYVSHGSDGDDDVYCAFTDLSKATKDCEESGSSLTTITLYRK